MLKLHSFVLVAWIACMGAAGCVSENDAAADDQLEKNLVDEDAELTPEEVAAFALDGDKPSLATSADTAARRRNVYCVTLSPFRTRIAAEIACSQRYANTAREGFVRADVKGEAPRLSIECCWISSGLVE